MDLVSAMNPPRLVRLDGEEYWCRALTLEDMATILAWLDDILPGQSDRMMPPRLSSDEAMAALDDVHGVCFLAWVALRHVGVGREEAARVASRASAEEWLRFISVLFSRRRTLGSNSGESRDIAETWWGPTICAIAERYHLSVSEIGGLSFDQIACLSSEGLPFEEPGRLSVSDVQAMWEAAHSKTIDPETN